MVDFSTLGDPKFMNLSGLPALWYCSAACRSAVVRQNKTKFVAIFSQMINLHFVTDQGA